MERSHILNLAVIVLIASAVLATVIFLNYRDKYNEAIQELKDLKFKRSLLSTTLQSKISENEELKEKARQKNSKLIEINDWLLGQLKEARPEISELKRNMIQEELRMYRNNKSK